MFTAKNCNKQHHLVSKMKFEIVFVEVQESIHNYEAVFERPYYPVKSLFFGISTPTYVVILNNFRFQNTLILPGIESWTPNKFYATSEMFEFHQILQLEYFIDYHEFFIVSFSWLKIFVVLDSM